MRPKLSSALAVLSVLLLVAVPLIFPADIANTLSRVLALALLAVSLDLLVGVSGMPSLGHAAPFGVGAYAAALVARDTTSFAPVPLLVAVVAGGLFALLTGVLMVRTKGTYFLMLTLAIAELAHVLAQRWEGLTGGTNGLYGIPSLTLAPGGEPVTLAGVRYWWILLIFLIGFAIVWWTSRSTLGRSLRGLRDNEERMASIGYSTFTLKLTVYGIAGAVAGAAGSLWVAQNRFVSPEDLGFEVSAMALLAVVVGGRGRLWGAVLGAALVTIVRDDIGASLGGRGPLLLGLVFIAAVYLLPHGFAGTSWRQLLTRRTQEDKA
ncbi:branched-chain amino acid ABC transporter permease [Janibacter limosus]|jgi:branched-chain amino acid transport system permease protein|uniref:Branched-chain amino acid ABC transporter permease n=1 Tax=Janibacter limosus TaxID=53458 RepID=A0A4P6MXN3_9MICO|nr:branched-chain amino acid ABC transporter permease [Janibacter limosus]QBF46777.1 branched-chain amino acid ABC transporter permease [Janibacter limosus]